VAGTGRRFGAWLAVLAALCLGLLVAAYSDAFGNAFHFDDSHVLVDNLYVRSLGNAPRFFSDARTFSSLPRNQTYRPLVSLSLALDYRLAGGLSPAVFHADQLAELALLGLALWAFYRRAMDRAVPGPTNAFSALFAATFFCVHTVNTETMNLMHARSEILSALGVISGFLVYLGAPRLRRFQLHLVPVALGALAKTPAVLFAPLLFSWEFLRPEESEGERPLWATRWRRAIHASLPAFVAGALLFWLVERVMAPPAQTYGGGDRLLYVQTQAWVWLHYLRLFVLPVGLTADSDLRLIPVWFDTRVLAGLAAIAGLVWIGWRSARHRKSWPVAFGLAWFAIGLAPTSSILPLAEPMNEHRVFLPFIGLALAAVWGTHLLVPGLFRRPAVAAAAGAAILLALATGTFVRNRDWRTGESLWADVTVKSPENGRAWMNYGVALMARGQLARARECYERAALFTPAYWTLEINRAIVEGSLGNPKAAEAHFRRAIELDPTQPDVHYYFGRWLSQTGRGPEAIGQLRTALRLSPAAIPARTLLMDLLAAEGDAAGAADLARHVAATEPRNSRARALADGRSPVALGTSDRAAYLSHGLKLGREGNFVESALAYRAALAIDPGYADALNNLGWTLGKLGFFAEAVPLLDKAVALRPDFALAHNNLAWVKGELSTAPAR
jgi:tetratricopeptide (TPR) repeat protein